MPSPITAYRIIQIAMQHIGVLAEGEVPSADQATDGLSALNDVLESWSIQSLAVWANLPETFALVAGKASYTVGPGGDWNTDRPIALLDNLTVTVDTVDFPVTPWSLPEYQGVGVKFLQQPIPQRFVFINDSPLATVLIYPTPSRAVPIVANTPRILTQVPNVATTLTLPPGYARALQYAVALELSPRYATPIDISAQARSTLAVIKRANRVSPISQTDPALLNRGGGWWGYYGG